MLEAPDARQPEPGDGPAATVRIVEDPHTLDTAALTNYSVVLLHFQNWQVPGPGVASRENLQRYVKNGGGLMSVHFACGAWYDEWPEFAKLVGRVWGGPQMRGHDPRGPFTVQIVDREHPITRGLKDWRMVDETYEMAGAGQDSHVLLTTDHPKSMPTIAWTRSYKRSRVFCYQSGHDNIAFSDPNFRRFLSRGVQWAGGVI